MHRRRNGLASGGGLGAELMINIALVSMYAILYIDILGPTFLMSGGAMAPLAPPVPPPMECIYIDHCNSYCLTESPSNYDDVIVYSFLLT